MDPWLPEATGSAAARAALLRVPSAALAGRTAGLCGGGRSRAALAQQHFRAVLELVGTIDDHRVPGLEAGGHGDVGGITRAQGHLAYAHALIGIEDVHIGTRCTALHARLRNERRAMQRIQQQYRVDELLREEGAVIVGKTRLEADRSGGAVDLAVDRLQGPGRELLSVA